MNDQMAVHRCHHPLLHSQAECVSPWINFARRGFRSCSSLGEHDIHEV